MAEQEERRDFGENEPQPKRRRSARLAVSKNSLISLPEPIWDKICALLIQTANDLLPVRLVSRAFCRIVDGFYSRQPRPTLFVNDMRRFQHVRCSRGVVYFATLPVWLVIRGLDLMYFPWSFLKRHFRPAGVQIVALSPHFCVKVFSTLLPAFWPRWKHLVIHDQVLIPWHLLTAPHLDSVLISLSTVEIDQLVPNRIDHLEFDNCSIVFNFNTVSMPFINSLKIDTCRIICPSEQVVSWTANQLQRFQWTLNEINCRDVFVENLLSEVRLTLTDSIKHIHLSPIPMVRNRLNVIIPPTALLDDVLLVHSASPPWPIEHAYTWKAKDFYEYFYNSSLPVLLASYDPPPTLPQQTTLPSSPVSLFLKTKEIDVIPWRYIASFSQLVDLKLENFSYVDALPFAVNERLSCLKSVLLLNKKKTIGNLPEVVRRLHALPSQPQIFIIGATQDPGLSTVVGSCQFIDKRTWDFLDESDSDSNTGSTDSDDFLEYIDVLEEDEDNNEEDEDEE